MPSKKKVNTETDKKPINNKRAVKEDDIDDDDSKSTTSTDSDILSGTFSQYDENEEEQNDDAESSESEVEDIEIEDANDDLEEIEGEEGEGEVEDVKPKKKKLHKKTVTISNDCVYNNIDFEEDYEEKEEQVPDNERITINRMTKYEKVRIIGIRAKQIMTGANILIKGVENKNPTEIAELELKYNMIPFKLKRRLPNGRYEIWKLSELEK